MKCAEVEIHDPHGRATRSVLRHELDRAQDKLERLDPNDLRDPAKDQLKNKRIRALANAHTHLHEARGYLHLAQLHMALSETAWGLAWLEVGEAASCGDESKGIAHEFGQAFQRLQGTIKLETKDVKGPPPKLLKDAGQAGAGLAAVLERLTGKLTAPTQGKRLSEPMAVSGASRDEATEEARKEREAIQVEAANPGAWNEPPEHSEEQSA